MIKPWAEFVVDVCQVISLIRKRSSKLKKNGAELPEPFANELVGMIERLNKGGGSTAKEGEKKKAVMEKPTKEKPFQAYTDQMQKNMRKCCRVSCTARGTRLKTRVAIEGWIK